MNSTTKFPLWSIGEVNGIDNTYEVHWVDWDQVMITLDGDEVVTFSSSSSEGFTSEAGVIDEAEDVVYEMETDLI